MLAADYGSNVCSNTGYVWVRIYATRAIKAGEELFIDYGDDFWINSSQHSTTDTPTSDSTTSVTSIWAAPAPYIESDDEKPVTPTPRSCYDQSDKENVTHLWAPQTPAPASPKLLGDYKYHHQSIDISFHQPLSPIPTHPNPNPNLHMIETYSFTQMYDPHLSILLPMNVTSHRHTMNVPSG